MDGNEHMANSKQMKMFLKKKNGDGNNFKTNRQEMMAFFGLIIFMVPHAVKYWKNDPQLGVQWVKDRWSRDRI